MPYIDRDETGKIKGVYTPRQHEGQEWIADDAPEVGAFMEGDREKLIVSAVQRLLDTTAQQRGYDNIFTLISYVASANPVFQREGQAGLLYRDRAWETCLQIKNDAIAGARLLPTVAEVLAEMPVIDWGE